MPHGKPSPLTLHTHIHAVCAHSYFQKEKLNASHTLLEVRGSRALGVGKGLRSRLIQLEGETSRRTIWRPWGALVNVSNCFNHHRSGWWVRVAWLLFGPAAMSSDFVRLSPPPKVLIPSSFAFFIPLSGTLAVAFACYELRVDHSPLSVFQLSTYFTQPSFFPFFLS